MFDERKAKPVKPTRMRTFKVGRWGFDWYEPPDGQLRAYVPRPRRTDPGGDYYVGKASSLQAAKQKARAYAKRRPLK
jgi:hypothetical protein